MYIFGKCIIITHSGGNVQGGALRISNGALTEIIDSTFSDNFCDTDDSLQNPDPRGGALSNVGTSSSGGNLMISNSTFTGNFVR